MTTHPCDWDHESHCTHDNCTQPASHRSFTGTTRDGMPIYDLVCCTHAKGDGVNPRRDPAEETLDIYPNLVVHDDRVTGSITIGRSRLTMWAIISTALYDDWAQVEADWSPEKRYGFGLDDLSRFLYDLLGMRGEFGRLLLVLANAERIEREQDNNAWGLTWWAQPDLVAPVVDQLRRCLAALDAKETT